MAPASPAAPISLDLPSKTSHATLGHPAIEAYHMNKAELAQYLVNLHTLLQAQSSGAHSVPSAVLSEEYNRNWALLKEEIDNEARTKQQPSGGSEAGADQSRGERE